MISSADYFLLKRIKDLQPVTSEQLCALYSNKIDGIISRLDELKNGYKYINFEFVPKDTDFGTTLLMPTNKYIITDSGLKALQDYKLNAHQEKIKLWLSNCLIPVIVSIITNLLCILLPKIIKLLKQIL